MPSLLLLTETGTFQTRLTGFDFSHGNANAVVDADDDNDANNYDNDAENDDNNIRWRCS